MPETPTPRTEAMMENANLNPVEAKLPLKFNGLAPAEFIKRAYGLDELGGPGRFDMRDPVQEELRRIKGWIQMAEYDALESRREVPDAH